MPTNPVFTPVDGNGFSLSAGGDLSVSIAAGATGPQVVKTGPGRLGRIVLAAANGAAAITVYDSATVASGPVIGVVPASAAAGVYDFQLPARSGITVGGASTSPALVVGYS
ncbi:MULTISPECIES: hypothetical protein [unclassified Streptomyces]|uniref:hypothetical protein n=1 Tax=unclassified Streptomyces TaxID=2593676 RepID=UPI00382C4AF0